MQLPPILLSQKGLEGHGSWGLDARLPLSCVPQCGAQSGMQLPRPTHHV